MSRQIDWDKPLSEDDRRWALDRGMYHKVALNDEQHGNSEEPDEDARARSTGVRGTEPSSQERTEPLERTPQTTGLHTDHAGRPLDPETGLARDSGGSDEDGDEYDEMSKGELRDEIDRRNSERDDDDRIPVSGNAEDLRARLREDDDADSE